MTRIPVLSFFTGAGFLDVGFIQAGFEVVWTNEIDPSFARGYEYGMGSLHGSDESHQIANTNSIIDIGPNQVLREAFDNLPRPDLFGIIGGPPCPDFSVGGKNRGKEGDKGLLSQVYVNRIMEIQPTFFLLENVPGMLRTKKHRYFLAALMAHLSSAFEIDIDVLNSLDFGVPQDRERVFLVGFSKKWLRANLGTWPSPRSENWLPLLERKRRGVHGGDGMTPELTDSTMPSRLRWFRWPREPKYHGAKERYSWPETSPFGGNPEKPEGIPEELMVGPLICNVDELAGLPNGAEGFRPKSDKFWWVPEGDVSGKSFKRLHRWRYSPAAAYGNNEVHLHPTEPRRLTVRECLRIQSVPDTYVLPPEMTLSSKFKTIGNGVPILLAQAVAQAIMETLTSGTAGGDYSGDV